MTIMEDIKLVSKLTTSATILVAPPLCCCSTRHISLVLDVLVDAKIYFLAKIYSKMLTIVSCWDKRAVKSARMLHYTCDISNCQLIKVPRRELSTKVLGLCEKPTITILFKGCI